MGKTSDRPHYWWPKFNEYLAGKITLSEYLQAYIAAYNTNFSRDYPEITLWLSDQDAFVDLIANECTPELCMEYRRTAISGIGRVLKDYSSIPIDREIYKPFHHAFLVSYVIDPIWAKEYPRVLSEEGPMMIYLGYLAICLIVNARIQADAIKEGTYAPLIFRHYDGPRQEDILGKSGFVPHEKGGTVPFVRGGVLGELFSLVQHDYKKRLMKKSGDQDYSVLAHSSISGDVNTLIVEKVFKYVPVDPEEAMILAMKGDDNMKFIPRKVVDAKLEEHTSEKRHAPSHAKVYDSEDNDSPDQDDLSPDPDAPAARKYPVLVEKESHMRQEWYSSARELVQGVLDSDDRTLIDLLRADPDMSAVKIGEIMGLSHDTVLRKKARLSALYLLEDTKRKRFTRRDNNPQDG